MTRQILSSENPHIKLVASLRQKKHRDETGFFVVEGVRLVQEAITSACQFELAVISEEEAGGLRIQQLIDKFEESGCPVIAAPAVLFRKISDTATPQGILAVLKQRSERLADLSTPEGSSLWVILDAIQDPGNVGTIIRTADAAGAAGVILTEGCADLYAGKTTRATMGSLFHIPVVKSSVGECLSFCKDKALPFYVAGVDAAHSYTDANLKEPCAIVFGNEGSGVGEEFSRFSSMNLKIPIVGRAESLNVASAAAIILFEAARQRGISLSL